MPGAVILILTVGEMPWPITGANHYHTQLGLLRQRLYNQRVGFVQSKIWFLMDDS